MKEAKRPTWREFEETTKSILQFCGLNPAYNQNIMGRQTDIWCKTTDSLASARIIVECKSTKDSEATIPVTEITDFCARLALARSSGVADQGWMITNGKYSSNSNTVIKDSHLEGVCRLLTFDSFLSSVIDFSSYFSQLKLLTKANKLEFIDPSFTVTDGKVEESKSFLDFCSEWASKRNEEFMLLLGDYGQGKTTCCQQILLSYITNDQIHGDRIPIYIRLRDVANQGYQLPAILRVCLQEQFGLHYHSFQLIKYLADSGRLLFIFDGLDEISYTGFWNEVFPSLRQLLSIASKKNKILITSRPGIFSSASSMSMTLDSLLPKDDEKDDDTRSITVILDYFDRPRVHKAIKQYGVEDSQKLLEKLYKHKGIADLIRRPITLQMVLDSLLEEKQSYSNVSSSANLYGMYTSKWLHRDSWRSNIQNLSLQKGQDFKSKFVEQLAWKMLTSGLPRVTSDYIDSAVKRYFGHIEGIAELLPAFANEIRLCSFLDWQLDGSLVFAHKSFSDYFVAKRLSSLNTEDQIHELSTHIFGSATLMFAAQLIDWDSIQKSDLFYKSLNSSSILCLNTIHILSSLEQKLALTVTLPDTASIDFDSKDVIVLTIKNSSIKKLALTSESSVFLEMLNVRAKQLDIRSEESTKIILRNCEIGEIICHANTALEIEGANTHVNSGSLFYESMQIGPHKECEFQSVAIDGPSSVSFEFPHDNNKLTKEQRLIGLGFISRRSKGKGRVKNKRHVKNQRTSDFGANYFDKSINTDE